MSTQPNLVPTWKEEVNRRLAAHKSRKASAPVEETQETVKSGASSRAAEAAARVAARYAKAPTYSEMQAAEARVAVRAAEIATKVALEAQAVAETALAELHAAAEQPLRGPAVIEPFAIPAPKPAAPAVEMAYVVPQVEPVKSPTEPEAQAFFNGPLAPSTAETVSPVTPELFEEAADGRTFGIRWEADMPSLNLNGKTAPTRHKEEFELSAEDWWTPADGSAILRNEPIEVEPQPTHANLIQFPRELVATRKMRPRLAESATAVEETEGQLSIFEVDPVSVSVEAEVKPIEEFSTDTWPETDWAGIELDEHPMEQRAPSPEAPSNGPFLAPLGMRLMATVVDGALIAAATVLSAFACAVNMQHLPAAKPAEETVVALLVLVGLVYHTVFFMLGRSTPGMKYAGIGLCTFDNDTPKRAQLQRRLGALIVSLLPVGLGLAWSVFDDDHLCWHDRISQTYLRKL